MTDSAEPAAMNHSGDINKMVDPLLALAERVEAGADIRESLWETLKIVDVDFSRIEVLMGARAYLDAIAALQEAVLPGSLVSMGHYGDDRPGVCYGTIMPKRGPDSRSLAPTLHQAWLAALLRAVAMERRTLQGDHHDR